MYYKGLSKQLLTYKFDPIRSVIDKERKEEEANEFVSAVCWRPVSCYHRVKCVKQGSHSTGKTGNMLISNSRQGKHREFENSGKTHGRHLKRNQVKIKKTAEKMAA